MLAAGASVDDQQGGNDDRGAADDEGGGWDSESLSAAWATIAPTMDIGEGGGEG